MYGDARNWDEDSYRETVLSEIETRTRTVFRTIWEPVSLNPNPDSIVVATSDGSIAAYSLSKSISNLPLGFSGSKTYTKQLGVSEPDVLIQGHKGPVYDVKFYGDDDNALLLSCGDDGRIRGWRWKELTDPDIPVHSQGNHLKPALDLLNPQHKGPWGALSPVPENNAIAVDDKKELIYTASGDSCAYCWDLETGKIRMVFKGHSGYLHCITARKSTNQIITGSEDGTARIWDCRSGKCVQAIDPDKRDKMNGSSSYVSCITLDASESWLVCGNGRSFSVWNLLASECFLKVPTRVSVQDVIFDDNQILAVGAEPVLSRFDINGAILSQIQCAPQSVFSLSLHPSGVTAVGGCGGLVDVISQFGSHLCTFQCK